MAKLPKDLQEIFGSQGFFSNTGSVMIAPSSITHQQASECVEKVNLSPLLRDLGLIMARELENELRTCGLRPADYAGLPNLPDILASRIAKALTKVPPEFANAFTDHLRRSS